MKLKKQNRKNFPLPSFIFLKLLLIIITQLTLNQSIIQLRRLCLLKGFVFLLKLIIGKPFKQVRIKDADFIKKFLNQQIIHKDNKKDLEK